jgi:hypothetical protein
MTDRELLEAAAKAAGMDYLIWTPGAAPCVSREHRIGDRICWNPLTDDGDALRLAVKLNLQVEPDSFNGDTIVVGNLAPGRPLKCATEPHDTDPYAATRRAIVRAAVEIGRSKT